MSNTYRYTELLRSFQGEGTHTGKNTLWLRWFLCNLQCNGFGQKDPTDESSYTLPYETIDITDITELGQLPVFEYGCDSSYSWAKKYRHLAADQTAEQIADLLEQNLRSPTNPEGKFLHPRSGEETHMCFTGGEPMMRQSQRGIEEVMRELHKRKNMPNFITVETNGTQKLSPEFREFLQWFGKDGEVCEWFWSFSPKLFNTSGEKAKKAIKPEVIADYQQYSTNGHLKFVVNGTQETWDELEQVVSEFREHGIEYPVWIMPVGATKEQQEENTVKDIVAETLSRGYNVSGRLHAHMLGNELGT
jgi:7-carboxy-7-deazaguanine synthase